MDVRQTVLEQQGDISLCKNVCLFTCVHFSLPVEAFLSQRV
jgi:hypothetical protein